MFPVYQSCGKLCIMLRVCEHTIVVDDSLLGDGDIELKCERESGHKEPHETSDHWRWFLEGGTWYIGRPNTWSSPVKAINVEGK